MIIRKGLFVPRTVIPLQVPSFVSLSLTNLSSCISIADCLAGVNDDPHCSILSLSAHCQHKIKPKQSWDYQLSHSAFPTFLRPSDYALRQRAVFPPRLAASARPLFARSRRDLKLDHRVVSLRGAIGLCDHSVNNIFHLKTWLPPKKGLDFACV